MCCVFFKVRTLKGSSQSKPKAIQNIKHIISECKEECSGIFVFSIPIQKAFRLLQMLITVLVSQATLEQYETTITILGTSMCCSLRV